MPATTVPLSAWPGRPRSIRARVTLLAMSVVGSLLLAAVLVTAALLHHLILSHRTDVAARAAREVAVAAGAGRLPTHIPAQSGVLVQVVSAGSGRVVASSAPLQGRPPITRARPSRLDTRVDTRVCARSDLLPDCVIVVGFDVVAKAYGPVTVYAAVPQPWILGNYLLESVMAGLCVVVLALAAWGMWRAVGRTLRPVAAIETEMAEITASDLSRRMPVPGTRDEIERLARTVNATLDRLERAVEHQRRFVSDASHELRSPITGLRTRIELALDDPAGTDPRETLEHALGDAERLHQIVDALLALARLDSGAEPARAPLDLGDLAEAEVARGTLRLPVTVRSEPGVLVEGDRLQLARVLLNLLVNADRHADARVEVEVRADGGEAVLEVRDDGPGVAPEDRERVFERFTRLASSRRKDAGGSGLGLPIAREIANAHGGRLYIGDSERGARFVLRLPLLRDPLPRDRPDGS
ncbi:sensor histidine kinase [Spirillospora sp. NBC_01491]|uniref:sensor histidine kinase n=1 Tax=Spirillospora sp. NBC_01491 TaxID=2976007 RepID=UPI002E37CB65|nr:HAMP domain-containing sensor histidine kinase [Spirillospora sp. NBC_01491]